MRLLRHRAVQYDSGPNLTSVVDVVMVVLIFLMLAGTFNSVQVLSGKPAQHGHQRGTPLQALSLDIRVQEDASTGAFIATGPDIRVAGSRDELLAALQAKQQKYIAAGIAPDDVQVVIEPARNVSYQHVLTVFETAGRAKFSKVAFAASRD
jgi:biopolymer transport protein ExbD